MESSDQSGDSISEIISNRSAELRRTWRDAAQFDDVAAMHISSHGEATLREISKCFDDHDDDRLERAVSSPPWFGNDDGADSPVSMLFALHVALKSITSEAMHQEEIKAMVSRMARFIDSATRARTNELQKEAQTDSLTGAMSRSAILRRLEDEAARTRRHKRPLSVVFLDVDGLKATNDEYGHTAGDSLLRNLTEVVMSNTRSTDAFGRVGGDEFLLLLPETDDVGASAVVTKLAQAMNESNVTVSFGTASVPWIDSEAEKLIEAADAAMRASKRSGK